MLKFLPPSNEAPSVGTIGTWTCAGGGTTLPVSASERYFKKLEILLSAPLLIVNNGAKYS